MLNEQQVEALCLGWFQEAGWHMAHGPDIAPGCGTPERTESREVVVRERLLAALARRNPQLPSTALEQAAHALQTVSEPQMVVRDRSVHRTLLNGVSVAWPKCSLWPRWPGNFRQRWLGKPDPGLSPDSWTV